MTTPIGGDLAAGRADGLRGATDAVDRPVVIDGESVVGPQRPCRRGMLRHRFTRLAAERQPVTAMQNIQNRWSTRGVGNQTDMGRGARRELHHRPLCNRAQQFHRRDVLAQRQQPRAQPLMGADAVHCIDGGQLAQQARDGGTRQPGFSGEVGQPRPAQSTKYFEQPERRLDDARGGRTLSVLRTRVKCHDSSGNSRLSVAFYTQPISLGIPMTTQKGRTVRVAR